MLRFLKKRWKSRKFSRRSIAPETPTHQITDIGAGASDDTNHGGVSRITTQDGRAGNQQLLAPITSTLTPRHESADKTHRGPEGVQNDEFCPSTSDLRSDEMDSNIRNPWEHENRGVQQPSDTAPERTSGGDQDGGDVHDLVQSGRSRVKETALTDRTPGRATSVVDLAKEPPEAFGPLKAVLGSIPLLHPQSQKTVAIKDKMDTICSRVATLGKLFEKPTSDEKEKEHRERLSIKLKEIEEQLLQLLRESSAPLRSANETHDSGDFSGPLEDLQEAVLDYMMAQQMAIYDQGCERMGGAEKSILNNFSRAKGADFRQDERKGCLKGTRGVVLNTIELWARDPTKSPVYWLSGLAGTGKSTIAKTIAERLFADGQLGASFFCSRDFKDRRDLQLIFPTLATQLARKYPEFRSIFVPLVQSDPEVAYESLYNQMRRLIVKPLKQSGISTIIVIDALDECEDEESASAILSVLGRLVSEIPKVKFFLTGRPEPRIYEGFRLPLLAKMTDTFVLHDVERDQVDSDIRLFFRTSFLELTSHRSGLDNWPTKEQLDLLCERAAGLFVYAAATARFIDNNKRGPRDQLDRLLESQKVGAIEGEALDTLYTSILQEAFSDDDPEDDAKTRSVLGVIVLATNPLSPSVIATLLGYDREDVPPLLSPAKSLLVLQEDLNHPVRPFHKSFPDFVTDPDRCINKRFHISPSDHHFQLLISCLDLINQTLAKNMCKLPDGVANSDVGDLKERMEEYIDPALQYACLSWHMHLVDADTTPAHKPTITSTLRRFLENKFLFWLEVLSVLGAVRNAVEALQVITDRLEEPSTLGLANDCFRFATGYFEVINASAPHIYHSALVFTPQKSIVRKLYESHARPFTRVAYGLPVSWDGNTAAATRPSGIGAVAWSPCNRFIAITCNYAMKIEVLDPVTLQRLQTIIPERFAYMSRTALVFSPDSRILTCLSTSDTDRELYVVSWDLQTGGVAGLIKWQGPENFIGTPSIAYSASGKMVGVRCRFSAGGDSILVFDFASGVYIHSHSLTGFIPRANHIWTHGEYLRFITFGVKTITIWEIGLTSDAIPTEVETLPTPEGVDVRDLDVEERPFRPDEDTKSECVQFHPAPCRLALNLRGEVMVWDAQNSKYLLHCTDAQFQRGMTFSSDSRFFACSAGQSGVYLWKESATGYIPHQILAFKTTIFCPLLSQNGGSIVVFGGTAIRLWRVEDYTTIPSSVSTRAPESAEAFLLDFSPDRMLAVVARKRGETVMVLDLKSGVLQLTIDVGMEVYGFGVIGDTITVIGDQRFITWDLPTGYHVPGAKVTLEDSARAVDFGSGKLDNISGASISPDSRHIVFVTTSSVEEDAQFYDGFTGELLATCAGGDIPHSPLGGCSTPFFAPGGRDLWFIDDDGFGYVLRVGDGGQVQWDPERRVDIEHPPEGYPWASSRGYRVTDDWWILGPDGKRLLMLPPAWQSPAAMRRVWKGQFFALLHGELPEPVVLELDG